MKKSILLTLASLLVFAGAAQATTFDVTDVGFTVTSGGLGDYEWYANPDTVSAFTLTASGSSHEFTYGNFYFAPTDPVPSNSTTVSFTITPPGGTAGLIQETATISESGGSFNFDFTDTTTPTVDFGNGGSYYVTFSDVDNMNQSFPYVYALQATLTLISDTSTSTVPEPGTIVLLGIGMFALAVFGKRRMNKEA